MPTKASKSAETESWREFLDNIRAAKEMLGANDRCWYRGHARSGYELLPSLLRIANGVAKEQDLFNDYERSAAHLQAKRTSDWELLFDMQHYGLPTRLLDWTDVLGVAIAFAMYNSKSDCEDSAIFLLNPLKLNQMSAIPSVKRVPGDSNFDYKSIYWNNIPFAAMHPIAVDPPLQSDRMLAQKGTFTIHGSSAAPLETQCPSAVKMVLLPAVAKPAAREFLEHAALNAYSIYPDIVGMALHIYKKHFEQ